MEVHDWTRRDNLIYALVATVGEAIVALKHTGGLHGECTLLGRPGVRDNDAREGRGAAHVFFCVFFCVRGEAARVAVVASEVQLEAAEVFCGVLR